MLTLAGSFVWLMFLPGSAYSALSARFAMLKVMRVTTSSSLTPLSDIHLSCSDMEEDADIKQIEVPRMGLLTSSKPPYEWKLLMVMPGGPPLVERISLSA
ncbi:hypothetical protein AL480_09965 [Stenotrophomonas maltophilia]|nr:hypothetical protein AL480_09965 [Stenotrophomonas maltophilia]KOO73949.1 hypothetical protein VK66_15610 [Stenotrophomonas maltophilia]